MKTPTDADEWIVGISKNRLLQGYLLSGFLAVVALLFIFVLHESSPDIRLIGIAQLLFAGLAYLLTYRKEVQSRRLLVINEEGICYQEWKVPEVSWGQIASVSVGGSTSRPTISFTLTDPGNRIGDKDQVTRQSSGGAASADVTVLIISDGHVAASLEEIEKQVKFYRSISIT